MFLRRDSYSNIQIVVVISVLAYGVVFLLQSNGVDNFNKDCISSIEKKIVRGDSMRGIVNDGDLVSLLFGYYKCNEIVRNDIVAYKFAGDDVPIIKSVKGISGDAFSLEWSSNGFWRLFINSEIQKTSDGKEYSFSEDSKKMLSLYEDGYHGIIPEGAYLILGNVETGSIDSSRFGLVGRSDIIAKVLVDK